MVSLPSGFSAEVALLPEISLPDLKKQVLIKQIIKVKEDLFFHTENIDALKKRLVDFLEQHYEITIPQYKEITGASRKYVIPLIE